MKLLQVACFGVLLGLSPLLFAQSFFERVGNLVDGVGNAVDTASRVLHGDRTPEKSDANDDFSGELPEGLPDGWHVGFVREPVFSSQMLVVEAGVEHPHTVVLVHGLGQYAFRHWEPVIAALAEDYHVLAFDLPGFGYSENPGGRYSPTNYARVLSWIIEKNDRPQVHLVGHSMGGAVALRYAASYPERVDRLVLADVAGILQRTAFTKHSSGWNVDVEGVPRPLQRVTATAQRWGTNLVETASGLPDLIGVLRGSDRAWNAILIDRPNANAALALIDEDFSGAIAAVAAPTLVIWGDKDTVAPLRTGRLLAGRMRHAELQVITGAEHVPMESHPDTFNKLLKEFLVGRELQPYASAPAKSEVQGDLRCNGRTGDTYSGRYRKVVLENCVAVVLDGVVAEQIDIRGSQVSLFDVRVESESVALRAANSTVAATNSVFVGEVGLHARNSRLDLAGVTVRGRETAVAASGRSRLIFSVSDIDDPDHTGPVHGSFRLQESELSESLE